MNSKLIGEITQINRYPVKSFAGETLNSVRLESYGLLGDRSHAFVDHTKEGWSRYITARQIPEMLSYQAELDLQVESELQVQSELQAADPGLSQVKILGPDGKRYQWNEQLLADIQKFTNKKISMERHSLMSEEQLAVDDGSILIITDQSLQKMEQLWGKPLDNRRFRANFILSLYDGVHLNDLDFIGKRLMINHVELTVKSLCERCSMITIDPDTLERDATLLKKINENMNLTFGMYADVEKVGMVHRGDQVYLTE
ncbi:MOSC domain protein [compost metagenome]